MPAATLTQRLADQLQTFQMEDGPEMPPEMIRGRAERYSCRVVETLRDFISQLEAESSVRADWPRADALGELFAEMSR